jgi:outer membrane protein assembly factor BamB
MCCEEMFLNKISYLTLAVLLIMTSAIVAACRQKNVDDSAKEENSNGKTLDWPYWRGPNRNSIVSDSDWDPTVLSGEVEYKWQANVGLGFSSVSVMDGLLYTAGYRNNVNTIYCLDLETGSKVWEFSYNSRPSSYAGPKTAPAIVDGTVYFFGQEGHLHALDAKKGKLIWEKYLPRDFDAPPPMWWYSSSPVIVENRLILNARKSGIAINKNTGEKIWTSEQGRPGYATAVLFENDTLVALFSSRALYAVDARNGKVVWSFPWITNPDVHAADPLVVGNQVFISSNYGRGCALIDFTDNKPHVVWENTNMASHFSGFVYIEGHIYGNSGNAISRRGAFRCIDIETGEIQWSENLGIGSLTAIGDKLILLNDRGRISVAEINPEAYREISFAELPQGLYWSPPVFARGYLLIRNMAGDIFCIDLSL